MDNFMTLDLFMKKVISDKYKIRGRKEDKFS